MSDNFKYCFTALVEVRDFGRMAYTVVYAPPSIIRDLSLLENPRLRIEGEVAGRPFQGAFQPTGKQRFYLLLSRKFCKAARIEIGDEIIASFHVADQDAVDIPKQLEFALNANDRARAVWDSISSGKKRGFAYRVASAKRIATIENRVEEVIDSLIAMKYNTDR